MSIRGDSVVRRVFTVRQISGRWRVSEGETVLADCADANLANAAAARLARDAFNSGVAVKIDREGWN